MAMNDEDDDNGDDELMMKMCSQVDKKVVRTEIGVLLKLHHPHIVSHMPL